MKTDLRQVLRCLALAAVLPLAGTAQPATPAPAEKKAAPEMATPAATPSASATSTSASASAQPAATPPESTAAAATATSTPSTSVEPQVAETVSTESPSTTTADAAQAVEPKAEPKPEPALRRLDQTTPDQSGTKHRGRMHGRGGSGNARVGIGEDMHLGADETADAVVSVFGSSTSEGAVNGAVISICGDNRVTGPVDDASVAVLGSNYVNSHVGDAVVAVLGDVELGENADVGDVVCIGGVIKRDPNAIVRGQIQTISIGVPWHGDGLSHMEGLRTWFKRCLMLGRPLAFDEHLGWAWAIAGGLLAFYVVLALLFRRGVDRCVETLATRPGTSVLAAFLTLLLLPIGSVLLALTGVGIAVIPFIVIGMVCAGVFGKTVMLAAIGRPITRLFGSAAAAHAAICVLIGGALMLLLYTVPFLGFVLLKVIGWLGVGVVVYTLILVSRREKPAVAAEVAAAAPAGAVAGAASIGGSGLPGTATATTTVDAPPVVISALPRAGFWIRLGAMLLDVILCGIVIGILNSILPHALRIEMPGALLLVVPAYGAIMWKLKGTTIGGIVCGLRVVRIDGRPIDWATAIVRTLGCFLSFFIIGLGFIWVAVDSERQSWHDKIAGTTVVLGRGGSLV